MDMKSRKRVLYKRVQRSGALMRVAGVVVAVEVVVVFLILFLV